MPVKAYKEGSKQYYSARVWYYKNGEKRSKYKKGFVKKSDAETWCTDTKRELQGLQPGADKIRVKEFLEKWMKTKRSRLSPTTLNGYDVNIKHINEHLGETYLSKIKLIDIQDMLDELSASGLKNKTVKYIYRTMHAAMEYAVKSEMLQKNPCKGAEVKEDEQKFEAQIYSAEDLKNLINLLREQEHPIYPAVLLASMRGMRRGECLGLRWSDIDFENKVAHIKNNYVVVNKKKYHRKVKTKESERAVNMEGFVAAELLAYKDRLKKEKIIQTYICEIGGQLPDPSHISRQLKSFQKANNLPLCRFHDLRHTFAVLQLEYGTDLDTLKRLLGHSKIGITSDTYLHQNTTLMAKASLKMDNIVNINCDTIVTNSDKNDVEVSEGSGNA